MYHLTFALLFQAAPAGHDNVLPEIDEPAVVDATRPSEAADGVAPTRTDPRQPGEFVIEKGHPILITVEAQVGSKISAARDFFPIKLAQAVEIDGIEILPAGIVGQGQVIHAKKGGFGGSAGELLLAARYLEHDGRRIPLRSFRFVEQGDELPFRGKDNSGLAIAATALLTPLGFLIGGGNTLIEPGTLATAKFRANETIIVSPVAGNGTETTGQIDNMVEQPVDTATALDQEITPAEDQPENKQDEPG